jgi:hypothetical protein
LGVDVATETGKADAEEGGPAAAEDGREVVLRDNRRLEGGRFFILVAGGWWIEREGVGGCE